MKPTHYHSDTQLVQAFGLQPGEDYGEAEECFTDITKHQHSNRDFEVYFNQTAGPLSQWTAFCLGIGTKSGLDRDTVIQHMQIAISVTTSKK